jgi:hypothetical protein
MWALASDEVATKPRADIATKRFMFTIMCRPLGFHVIDRLPTGAKMNSAYYTLNVIQRRHRVFFPQGRQSHTKRQVVQVDNCSVHTSTATEAFMNSRLRRAITRGRWPKVAQDSKPLDLI